MSSDQELVEEAVDAYEIAVTHSRYPIESRKDAARQFRAVVAEFDRARAVPPFVAALASDDYQRRYAAARVLVASRLPEAAAGLLHAYATRGPELDTNILRKMGRQVPMPDGAWDMLEQVQPFEQGALIEALFARETTEAERRWHQLIAEDTKGYLAERAIVAVARWSRPDLLRALINSPRRVDPDTRDDFDADLDEDVTSYFLKPNDIRLNAAFQLGLRGDLEAIDFLIREAMEGAAAHSVDATVRLADLGIPRAVAFTARHLMGDNKYASTMALSAAGCLRSPALGSALCTLAERATPTGVDALRVLASMTGRVIAEPNFDDPDPSAVPPAMRKREVMAQRTALIELDPSLRYRRGCPQTLPQLAADLTSNYQGEIDAAAYTLQSVTGDDFGFDPNDDLIANLDAIEAWRARAAQPPPVGSGEWTFHGKRLPPPTTPT